MIDNFNIFAPWFDNLSDPGDFSDSDKKCAENFGIDYIDVRDFLEL